MLSDCEASSCVYEVAAALIAVCEEERATSAEAHLVRVRLGVRVRARARARVS